jgi:hypothetical protein
MAKTRKTKHRHFKKNKQTKKLRGGLLIDGLPPCPIMSEFPITQEAINSFTRLFRPSHDCFINALQLIKAIDSRTADIMRICIIGLTGFNEAKIEMIMSLIYSYNYPNRQNTNMCLTHYFP